MAPAEVDTEQELRHIATLLTMGFEISRLEFYRWLVDHCRDPEWVGVTRLAAAVAA